MTDDEDVVWWVFQLPGCVTYVPGCESEAAARKHMAAVCYPNAPVDTWPLLETLRTSRNALIEEFARKARANYVAGLFGRGTIGNNKS